MVDYVDEICLLIVCCLVAAFFLSDPLAVVGLLAAVVAVCSGTLGKKPFRIMVQAAFACMACATLSILCFLPLAAYVMMHERNWAVRLIWVVPLCVQAALGAYWQILVWVAALCVVASIMAVKDVRAAFEHASLQQAYDLLREQTLSNAEPEVGASQGLRVSRPERYEPAFFEGLTKRELAVVNLVAEGLGNREISQELFLSEGTVRNHISSILSKKNLQNRTQIAVMYFRG